MRASLLAGMEKTLPLNRRRRTHTCRFSAEMDTRRGGGRCSPRHPETNQFVRSALLAYGRRAVLAGYVVLAHRALNRFSDHSQHGQKNKPITLVLLTIFVRSENLVEHDGIARVRVSADAVEGLAGSMATSTR